MVVGLLPKAFRVGGTAHFFKVHHFCVFAFSYHQRNPNSVATRGTIPSSPSLFSPWNSPSKGKYQAEQRLQRCVDDIYSRGHTYISLPESGKGMAPVV